MTMPKQDTELLSKKLAAVIDEPMTLENMNEMSNDMTGYIVKRMLPIIEEYKDKSVNEARVIIACPVCLGVGTVASGFYPIDSVTSTGFGRQQCRTCKGETVIDANHLNKKGEE